MLTIEQIEEICNRKFPCKIQDKGFGIRADNMRTVHVIVGKKDNIAWTPLHDGMSKTEQERIKKTKRFIPDVRIIHLPGGADEEWLLDRIKNITESLPEDQEIGDIKVENEKSVNGLNMPKPVDEQTPKTMKQHDTELASQAEEAKKNDEMMGAIGQLTDAISDILKGQKDLHERLGKLEKPTTKPAKKADGNK